MSEHDGGQGWQGAWGDPASGPPVGDIRPGMTIGGYRVDAVAGKGGMGVVCRATQLALARTVALKVISPDFAGDPTFRYRFGQECQLAASLDHPNIVPIIEAGEDAGLLFVSMRWVEGVDLGCLVDNMGPLAPDRALGIVAQVASALDTAHGAGLIHRDVKPANILIETRNGSDHAYLSDFGLVKRVGSDPGLTGSHGWIGTVDYVAPEQVRGEEIGAAADIYALGGVLYTALTGTVPFPRPDTAARLWACMNDPLPPLGASRPDLPAGLDGILAWAMAKEPAQRYRSAGDMVAALQATLAPPAPAPAPPVLAPTAPAPASWDQPEPSPAETAASSGQPEPIPPERPQGFEPTSRRRLGRRWTISAVALVAVVAVVAAITLATGGGKTKAPRVAGSSTPVRQASIGPGRTMTFQLADSSSGPVNAEIPSQPIASVPSSVGGMTLQLYLAKRQPPGAVLVVFALQIDQAGATALNGQNTLQDALSSGVAGDLGSENQAISNNIHPSVSAVALLDPSGLKEYQTFMSNPSDDSTCLCSALDPITGGTNTPAAGIHYLAALVSGPPTNVKSVSFVTGLGTIGNVTISG